MLEPAKTFRIQAPYNSVRIRKNLGTSWNYRTFMDWRFQFGDPPRTEEHGRTMRLIQIGHIDLRFFPWPSDSYNAIKFILASWWCVSWPQGCVTHWPVVPDKWQEVLVNGSPNSLCAKCWWQRTSPAFCSMFPFSIGKILSFSLSILGFGFSTSSAA